MKNILFSFVRNNIRIKDKPFNIKPDSKQNNFAYYDLDYFAHTIQTETTAYTLEEHHISIYENVDPQNAFLSHYHYTAYFRDEQNNKYQLHVYFDLNGEIVAGPIFSAKQKDAWIAQDIDPEFALLLKEFSLNAIRETQTELFNQYENYVQRLIEKHNKNTKQLEVLSANLPDNIQEYLAALQRTLNTLAAGFSFDSAE